MRPGDIVRSREQDGIGVVLGVVDSGDTAPDWELHVDWIDGEGNRDGVGVWRPEDAVVVTDAKSLADARALGLRGPDLPGRSDES